MATSKSMTKSALINNLAETNEMTRKEVIAFMESLVGTAYKEAKNGFTLPGIGKLVLVKRKARMGRNPATGETIKIPAKKVVKFRIAKAANKPEYYWEFAVIQDDEAVNAFALPGGKVAIFTGILKHTKNEDGLATVMAHEVAHALQRHGAERYSRGIIEQVAQLGTLAGAATGAVDPGVAMGAMSAYGVGISLPNNRRQESEADFIGLQLMAKAGYDPRAAVGFWERMSGCPKNMIGKFCFRSNAAVPEFLSTHPSDVSRIKQIEAWIPNALKYYHPPPAKSDTASSTDPKDPLTP